MLVWPDIALIGNWSVLRPYLDDSLRVRDCVKIKTVLELDSFPQSRVPGAIPVFAGFYFSAQKRAPTSSNARRTVTVCWWEAAIRKKSSRARISVPYETYGTICEHVPWGLQLVRVRLRWRPRRIQRFFARRNALATFRQMFMVYYILQFACSNSSAHFQKKKLLRFS